MLRSIDDAMPTRFCARRFASASAAFFLAISSGVVAEYDSRASSAGVSTADATTSDCAPLWATCCSVTDSSSVGMLAKAGSATVATSPGTMNAMIARLRACLPRVAAETLGFEAARSALRRRRASREREIKVVEGTPSVCCASVSGTSARGVSRAKPVLRRPYTFWVMARHVCWLRPQRVTGLRGIRGGVRRLALACGLVETTGR